MCYRHHLKQLLLSSQSYVKVISATVEISAMLKIRRLAARAYAVLAGRMRGKRIATVSSRYLS